jgi:hypothetical protein
MAIKFLALALVFCFSARIAGGQQSLFQSSSGDTAIFLSGQQNGVLLFNLATSKATVGYLHELSGSSWGFGGDLTGVAQGGVVSLVKNGVPQSSVGGDFTVNKQRLFWKPPPLPQPGSSQKVACTFCSDWLFIQFAYQRSNLYTLPTLTPPVQAPLKHGFDGYTGRVAYNSLLKSTARVFAGDYLLGASLGGSRTNNTNTPTTLSTVQVSNQVLTGNLLVTKNSKSAYVGAYIKYISVPLNADAIWYPDRARGYLGLDLFERSNIGQAPRYVSPGFGVFFNSKSKTCPAGASGPTPKNGGADSSPATASGPAAKGCHDPSRPLGGLTVSYQNHKAQVAVVTGWNF